MTKKVKLKQGKVAELKTLLGMDSDEAVKKAILAVHGALALDSDDKEDKKAEDEDDEEVIEVAEDEQTQAEKDNESEAMRLKAREDRERKDRDADKKAEDEDEDKPKTAMDSAALVAKAVAQTTALFEAREKVQPIVGKIACDSAEEVYKTALAKVGASTVGIHPSAYSAMVDMHLNSAPRATIAQDSAFTPMSSGLKDFTKHIRG